MIIIMCNRTKMFVRGKLGFNSFILTHGIKDALKYNSTQEATTEIEKICLRMCRRSYTIIEVDNASKPSKNSSNEKANG